MPTIPDVLAYVPVTSWLTCLEGRNMRRMVTILCGAVAFACTDPAGPEVDTVTIEVTSMNQQASGQWLVQFRITNHGPSTVFLPRCDDILTGLETWTGSDWLRVPVESCMATPDQSFAVEPQAVVDGDRALGAPGRYRLHVRYSREAGVDFDSIATTGPIDIA
jgi:hypothetical protein